jgi:hypothetical protein
VLGLGDQRLSKWPFHDPENVATFTVRQVTEKQLPILRVIHDADDGGWQFLTGAPIDMADAMLVSLRLVFGIDPTIGELFDLPVGWEAERSGIGEPWRRSMQQSA